MTSAGAFVRYAAYGSNLLPQRLQRRVPSARLLGVQAVDGWALRFNKRGQDGSGKCNIVPAAEQIHVAVFEMREVQRANLDRIEGLNVGYHALELVVPDFGACFAYSASASHIDETVAPFGWYKELVLAGCILHGMPSAYAEAIRALAHVDDEDEERHREHMAIARMSSTP